MRGSWWARRSLRARLTAAALVVITLGMAAAALLVWRLHSVLLTNLDASLSRQVQSVAEDAAVGDLARPLPGAASESGVTAVQVISAGGRVITSSANIDGEGRLFTVPGGAGEPSLATVDDASLAAPYRVAALRVAGPSGPVTVYAGAPTNEVTTSVAELGAALTVGVPVVIVALGLVGWLLLGRALRPVEALRRQAAAIPGTDPDRRLEVLGAGDELARLAVTFNELLARIASSTDQQRRFVADAAHELRSPLSALRTRLEINARTGAGGGGDNGVLQDVIRLAEMVDGLLALARLDAHVVLPRHPVDLDDLVWQEAHAAREQGPPEVDTTGISPARVLGDPQALRRVVHNLVSNARRHARETITLRLGMRAAEHGPQVVFTVADDGPGIPLDERQRVFERFTRLDEARGRDAGGAGLGLAIVRDVVIAHGGAVWIEDNEPGARLCVQLPASPPE